MLNLIRMNLYRFIKTKSLYVLLIITITMTGIIVTDQQTVDSEFEQAMIEEAMAESDGTVGVTLAMPADSTIPAFMALFTTFINSGTILIFTGLFAVLFSNSERAGGYLKNLNSCAKSKGQIFLAKLPPVIAFVISEFLLIPLTVRLLGIPFEMTMITEFFLYVTAQLLLHIAYGVFMLMLMEAFRNLAIGILASIFIGGGVGILLVGFLENLIHIEGLISGHMLVGLSRMIAVDNISQCAITTLISGVVGMTMYLIIGTVIFRKRDLY